MKQVLLIIGFVVFYSSCKTNSKKLSQEQNRDTKDMKIVDNRKMAFQNGEFVSYFDFHTKKITNLTKGLDPCISPDSKWIAYTETSNLGDDHMRFVRLINTENKTKKGLNINNNNYYNAVWSPTGEYLAFCIQTNNWQIGLITPNNPNSKIVIISSLNGLYAPTWSNDGKFIFGHDLSILYKYNTNGELIEKFDLEELFETKFYFTSSTRFLLALDNETLIFDGGIDEHIEGLNEPSSAIFCYNLNTKRIRRISKKGLCAIDLWIDKQDRIYFSGFEDLNKPRIIYQTSLLDTTLNVVIENGMRPSISQHTSYK